VTVELTPYDLSRARIVFRAKWGAGLRRLSKLTMCPDQSPGF